MNDDDTNEERDTSTDTAQHPPVVISPDEQLADAATAAAAPRVPGVENADSDLKKEFNPNSE